MEVEQFCECGPGCRCGDNCTCLPGCPGDCGPCGPCDPFEPFQPNEICGLPPLGPKPPKTPRVFEPAPDFEDQAWFDGMIQTIKLFDYRGKWVVLFFYSFDFTFVCTTEICAFSDGSDNFESINCQIIGASCDPVFVNREFALRERKLGGVAPLKIPLLLDSSHGISKIYGYDIWRGESKGAIFRATYNIYPNGIINISQ